ncbi:MAG: serpin family protein [Anaerolineaceae bacterium]|nr:serpin family protein [Anaerolineaceae bacterium]
MNKIRSSLISLMIASTLLVGCNLAEPTQNALVQGTPISGIKVSNTEEPVKTIAIAQGKQTPSTEAVQTPTLGPTKVPLEVQQAGQTLQGGQSYILNQKITDSELKALIEAENQFTLDLYKQVAQEPGNLFFSPFSLYSALTMAYAGTKQATAGEMIKTLHLPYTTEKIHQVMNGLSQRLLANARVGDIELVKFNIANALWAQKGYPFLPEYLDTLSANYDAGLKLVDYKKTEEARKIINDWVAEQTKNRIQDLMGQGVLNPATKMVLTNAIYFKANWQNQFKEQATSDSDFYLEDGSAVMVKMMSQQNQFAASQNSKFNAVEIPYEGGNFSMVIVMPKDKSLTEFEKEMGADLFKLFSDKPLQTAVQLSMPKFELDQSFALAETLKTMGMKAAFGDDADFSGMTGSKDLKITDVLHKAFLQVNERGTEAAAATGIVFGPTSARPPEDPLVMRFDHPFLLIIRENTTNATLFMGRFVKP